MKKNLQPIRNCFFAALLLIFASPVFAKSSAGGFANTLGSKRKPKIVLHHPVTHEGISVEVQALTAQQTRDIFGVDLLRRGVQPLVVKIKNDGAQACRVRKADWSVAVLAASEAAKVAYENPIVVGSGLFKRGLGAVGRVFFPVKRLPEERPVTNRELQEMFVREELPDAEIPPAGFAQGFVFIRPLAKETALSLKLSRVSSGDVLVFEVPAP